VGYRELVEALREEGEQKAAALRRDAGEEEGRLREEAAKRLRLLGEEYARRTDAARAAAAREVLAAAERKARLLRLAAQQALAERLLRVARDSLAHVRERGGSELFASLASELPSLPWDVVRVNPADEESARRLFPGAEVITDETITGGMEVVGEEGGLRVVNTLEKRLERGWPELLPLLAADIHREAGDGGASADP